MAEQQVYTKVYDLEYFSGAQLFIYIGDVWIDEITSFQYRTIQTKTPLYGYASQLWDTCAAGHVIVQGAFTINFKEQGYLWAVLRRFKGISEAAAGLEDKRSASRDKRLALQKKKSGPIGGRPATGSNINAISRASIERLVQGNVTRKEKYEFYNSLAGYATFDIKNPKDKVFEDIAEVFEDQVWTVNDNNTLNSQLRRTDSNEFDNFDIYVVFGNYANKKANHTVQKIIDVRLTSQGKTIVIDGQPIQESYEFIAQTVA